MATTTAWRALVVGVLLTNAACGKSKPNLYDQLLAENEAALKKRLGQLRAVLDAAKKRPPLTTPTLTVRGAEPQFIGLEETTDLEQHGYQGQPGCHANYDGSVYALLAGKGVRQENPDAIADMIRRDFKQTLTPPYAMVCVQLESEAPASGADKTFTGGTYQGECRFFEIDSATYLGGVAISTQMSSALVNTYNNSGLTESMGDAVTSDLEQAIGIKPPKLYCSWPSK